MELKDKNSNTEKLQIARTMSFDEGDTFIGIGYHYESETYSIEYGFLSRDAQIRLIDDKFNITFGKKIKLVLLEKFNYTDNDYGDMDIDDNNNNDNIFVITKRKFFTKPKS